MAGRTRGRKTAALTDSTPAGSAVEGAMTLRNTPLRDVSLDDKFDLTQTRIFVTGYQALVRMCLAQKERDRRAGLNTACYVTGYRGSPLGGLDYQFQRTAAVLGQ